MSHTTTLEVAQHFEPGTKARVHVRASDQLHGGEGTVKTLTVPASGTVELTGLEPHADYWLAGDNGQTVAFTATGPSYGTLAEEQDARSAAIAKTRGDVSSPAGPGPVEMPSDIHPSNFEKSDGKEAHPRAAQIDVPKGTPQRTSTPLGTAYPVDPDEIQPQPGKEHVKPGTPQRDGAEVGYASPVDPNEVQPGEKYEDQKGPQRTGADTGTAVPVAKGSLVDQDEVKDSSVSKAKGATVAVKGTDKVPPRKSQPTKATTKTQKAKVNDPIKPAAKRAVRKGA